jgi:hypothetical protein
MRLARSLTRRWPARARFTAAARQAVRRLFLPPPEAYAEAVAFLSDTLDWLNLWHDTATDDGGLGEEFDTITYHLSPHP